MHAWGPDCKSLTAGPLLVAAPLPCCTAGLPAPVVLYRFPNMKFAADSSDPAIGGSRWLYCYDAATMQTWVQEWLLVNLQGQVGGWVGGRAGGQAGRWADRLCS